MEQEKISLEDHISKYFDGSEDAIAVKQQLTEQSINFESLYVGFSFHEKSFENLKLLNTLSEVIPPIAEFISHKGMITAKLLDGRELEFSGDTTSEIVKILVEANK